ncbi:MAG: glycosyltransferase, partial [Chitinivibrionales bacterium]|nr:glycosyltransferase [Chitinivibrionales bacterium]
MTAPEVLFWLSCFVLCYAYGIYPLLLPLLARLFGSEPRQDGAFTPAVTVIVPAYNEGVVIRKKINNILALDYPADKLSVLVGSDASTDDTHEKVLALSGPRVRLWIAPRRGGKTAVLNQCAQQVAAEIIVFTDANTMFDRESLRLLVRNFADGRVGGAAGRIDHVTPAAAAAPYREEVAYRAFEVRLKKNE